MKLDYTKTALDSLDGQHRERYLVRDERDALRFLAGEPAGWHWLTRPR